MQTSCALLKADVFAKKKNCCMSTDGYRWCDRPPITWSLTTPSQMWSRKNAAPPNSFIYHKAVSLHPTFFHRAYKQEVVRNLHFPFQALEQTLCHNDQSQKTASTEAGNPLQPHGRQVYIFKALLFASEQSRLGIQKWWLIPNPHNSYTANDVNGAQVRQNVNNDKRHE